MTWKTTYETWGNFEDLETNLKEELVSLAENEKMLEDAFYAPLEFGTAGMRGVLGVGVNQKQSLHHVFSFLHLNYP